MNRKLSPNEAHFEVEDERTRTGAALSRSTGGLTMRGGECVRWHHCDGHQVRVHLIIPAQSTPRGAPFHQRVPSVLLSHVM